MEGFVKDENKKNFSNTDSITVVQKQHAPVSSIITLFI